MKLILKTLILTSCALLFSVEQTHAFGSKAPEPVPEEPTDPPKTEPVNVIIELGVNLAIIYAKQDPRYATILYALGIHNYDDLENFLRGNQDGQNFRNIISRLAFQAALKDSRGKEILKQLGINNEQELREFLNNQDGSLDYEDLLDLALQNALNNPKYSTWLRVTGIQNVDDIKALMGGLDEKGNLQSLVLTVGLYIVSTNEEYKEYIPYIQAAMLTLGLYQGDDGTGSDGGSDDDIIDIGPFNGMTVGETKAVQKLK